MATPGRERKRSRKIEREREREGERAWIQNGKRERGAQRGIRKSMLKYPCTARIAVFCGPFLHHGPHASHKSRLFYAALLVPFFSSLHRSFPFSRRLLHRIPFAFHSLALTLPLTPSSPSLFFSLTLTRIQVMSIEIEPSTQLSFRSKLPFHHLVSSPLSIHLNTPLTSCHSLLSF